VVAGPSRSWFVNNIAQFRRVTREERMTHHANSKENRVRIKQARRAESLRGSQSAEGHTIHRSYAGEEEEKDERLHRYDDGGLEESLPEGLAPTNSGIDRGCGRPAASDFSHHTVRCTKSRTDFPARPASERRAVRILAEPDIPGFNLPPGFGTSAVTA